VKIESALFTAGAAFYLILTAIYAYFARDIVGIILLIAIFALELWLLPGLVSWTIAVLLFALFLSAIVQLALGHRGKCWLWRTLRWWIGPVGTLVDPIEMG
jgi:small-conductance mechanosensitive channel